MEMNKYKEMLSHSFKEENERSSNDQISRMEYLAYFIFNFTTYDSEIGELFAKKAILVCKAISSKTTYDFIKSPDNYQWYLIMCNMPFFSNRLDWGTSIRGAWWSYKDIKFSTTAFWSSKQETEFTFTSEEWGEFINAIIEFSEFDSPEEKAT